ncbi:Na+/galactose cotransporter [bacterium CPR1]|nr:Na+/galactose cotransporter [bacterium CPR1]
MNLHPIDWLIMLVYFVFVLGIGFVLKRFTKTSKDFFEAGKSIPAWVAGLAFISANLGAQEVIGMAASGAKYGIATSHFYWVGAIPAMIFVGLFMMPFYYGSRARSVPEYLRLRFDEKTRALNAITFALMTVCSSGVSMYAMAKLIEALKLFDQPFEALGIDKSHIFLVSILLSAVIVLGYIFLGGLTSAIYNEVLQFFLIVAGFFPLVWLGLQSLGGWEGLKERMVALGNQEMVHTWKGMSSADTNSLGVEWFGMVMGLGFVLSFGYWCTDFLVVQRAMAADSMTSARKTPLIAAVPKMLFPFLVIMPGLIAVAITPVATGAPDQTAAISQAGGAPQVGIIPNKLNPSTGQLEPDYDMVIPTLLLYFFPAGMLGLGLTALLASFMSGMAGNVTAFNTVWTYDIYQAYLKKEASDEHYLWVGRMATVWGIGLSMVAAYLALQFNNIMEVLQLVFAFVNAPLFATFLLGMIWKRATGNGAFAGLVSGTLAAFFHHCLTLPAGAVPGIKGGLLGVLHTYPNPMAQTFYTAIAAWTTCFVVTILVSLVTKPRPDEELKGLVYSLTERPAEGHLAFYQKPAFLAVLVGIGVILLNLVFY